MKTALFLFASIVSLCGSSKLPYLYNCWQFDRQLSGADAQSFEITSPAYDVGLFGNALKCSSNNLNSCGSAIGTTSFSVAKDFSAMVWIKPNATTVSSQTILDNRGGISAGFVSSGFSLLLKNTGLIQYNLKEGAINHTLNSTNAITNGGWACIIFGYNGASQTAFLRVNDAPQESTYTFTPSPLQICNISVGCAVSHTGTTYDGLVDLLALWNVVLTEVQMQELWNGGAGLDYPFP